MKRMPLKGHLPENKIERDRVLELSKKWIQERVRRRCSCGNHMLVIDQDSGGGACGGYISVDITYNLKCPDCFETTSYSVTLDDSDF